MDFPTSFLLSAFVGWEVVDTEIKLIWNRGKEKMYEKLDWAVTERQTYRVNKGGHTYRQTFINADRHERL